MANKKFGGCKVISDAIVTHPYPGSSYFRTMFLNDDNGNSIRMVYDSHNGSKSCWLDVWGPGSIGWNKFATGDMVEAEVLSYDFDSYKQYDASTKAFEKLLKVFKDCITE